MRHATTLCLQLSFCLPPKLCLEPDKADSRRLPCSSCVPKMKWIRKQCQSPCVAVSHNIHIWLVSCKAMWSWSLSVQITHPIWVIGLILHAVMTCKVFAWGGLLVTTRAHKTIITISHEWITCPQFSSWLAQGYTEPKHLRTTAECDSAGKRQWLHRPEQKQLTTEHIMNIFGFFPKKILHFSNTMFQRAAKIHRNRTFALDSYGACASCPSFFASISILASNSAVVMWSWWS